MGKGAFEEEVKAMLEETGAMLEGHFLLASGLHSPRYVQCALLLRYPRHARRCGKRLAEMLSDLRPELVVSPALGGLIIGHEVASHLDVPFLFCERVDGRMALKRFPAPPRGSRFAVVEDVITTGLSTRETAQVLIEAGCTWVGSSCVVDRSGGKASLPHEVISLIEMDIPTYDPEDCPLCRQGLPLSRPGTRQSSL